MLVLKTVGVSVLSSTACCCCGSGRRVRSRRDSHDGGTVAGSGSGGAGGVSANGSAGNGGKWRLLPTAARAATPATAAPTPERPAFRELLIVRTSNSGPGHQLDVQRDDLTAASARRSSPARQAPAMPNGCLIPALGRGSVLLSCRYVEPLDDRTKGPGDAITEEALLAQFRTQWCRQRGSGSRSAPDHPSPPRVGADIGTRSP